MDKNDTRDTVERLIGEHAASLLTDDDYDHTIDQAAIPDPTGAIPGATGWVPSYEPYWAAAEAVTLLAIRAATAPALTEITAEGATFKRQGPNWWQAAQALREQSPIAKAIYAATGGLGVISVDTGSGYDTTANTWPGTARGSSGGDWT